MGDVNSMGLPESGARSASAASTGKSRWWIWLLVAGVIAVGFWYFRGRSASQAQGTPQGAQGGPAGSGGRRGGGTGPQVVPVVVAPSQSGDLPVYFNGLGTVTAFNTVTIRSRVDGQIIKINFTEGQFVHQGDPLVEIDPGLSRSCSNKPKANWPRTRRNARMLK